MLQREVKKSEKSFEKVLENCAKKLLKSAKKALIPIEKSSSFGAGTLVWDAAQNHPCEVPTWGFSVVLGGFGLGIWRIRPILANSQNDVF
jgi:hypothetical protein